MRLALFLKSLDRKSSIKMVSSCAVIEQLHCSHVGYDWTEMIKAADKHENLVTSYDLEPFTS